MAWADTNGTQIYYEVHGDEEETIVFAHGGGGNHLSWWQQVPYFRERYRCVVFDHRGFAQSPEVENGPGAAAFPEDLRGLLDHIGVERAFVVGQSMGGRSAMGFAVAYPERTRGLVVADSTGTIDDPELARLRQAARAGMPNPPPLEGFVYSPDFPARRPDLAFLYHAISALNGPRERTFEIGARPTAERYNLTTASRASFKVPTLFIAGSLDILATPEVVARAVSLVPGAQRVEVPGSGHSAYYEDPSAWNQAVGDFIRSVIGS
jgi:3-oxoadipate enol-lactonase